MPPRISASIIQSKIIKMNSDAHKLLDHKPVISRRSRCVRKYQCGTVVEFHAPEAPTLMSRRLNGACSNVTSDKSPDY